jgi:(4-O-methyl)-D-glucuronate---lignin esterase
MPAVAPDQPAPRTDQNSIAAHVQLLKKARKAGIDIYFEGDSITRRWAASEPQYKDLLANWNENFSGWTAANFGWGGDTTQNILWRVENGELDGVNPRVIVLLAGTNNLGDAAPAGADDVRAEEVTRGVQAILHVMRAKAPDATIILMGITPRNDHGMEVAATIDRINDGLSRCADGKKVRYLNINEQLADKNGKPYDGMTLDGLHLSVKGYQVWADALKPVFTELLGPPGQTGQAPLPEGVPAAHEPRPIKDN